MKKRNHGAYCENCPYYNECPVDVDGEWIGGSGECLKKSPLAGPPDKDGDRWGLWPLVNGIGVCGEHPDFWETIE